MNKNALDQVSVQQFEFLHPLDNLSEPDAAYGACNCRARHQVDSPLWHEVVPETVMLVPQ